MTPAYTEDELVQKTTAEYLEQQLGWESVYAYNTEDFGPDSLLGRSSDKEVVLTRYLKQKLIEFNPGLADQTYDDAVKQIAEYSFTQLLTTTNREKYALLKDGVQVSFRNENGETEKKRLRIFDFQHAENNHFLAVREFWIKGALYRRRADLIGFVNGIPLLFFEAKNINKNLRVAYEQNLSDYKQTIPHLFHHNAFIVLGNGVKAKIGSVTSRFEHFHEWKRLAEEEPGVVDMETMLKGICNKQNFMDLFENFITFDDSTGKLIKIVARNHQYLGVNRAVASLEDRNNRSGKLGVFWHTQGSGKSYSMVFFTAKVHRKIGNNFTFLICTDRDDLDSQIYKTFAGCGLVNNDTVTCRAGSGEQLKELLTQQNSHLFTLIQKFNKKVDEDQPYSMRDDIIVITDEAHRTQYGTLALNMRNALPNASYIGFTGTPLFKEDEITRKVFGGYVSTYDFKRAVDDGATVPLYYDARGEYLGITTDDINEKLAEKIEEFETDDIDLKLRLERDLKREYHIITSETRLDKIAKDFVEHYSNAWESGKAMLVCIDKVTCVKMFNLIEKYWSKKVEELNKRIPHLEDEQEEILLRRKIEWMDQTVSTVVISEEQGEVAKFKNWDLDITPHRTLIKNGFELEDGKRIPIDIAFKDAEHPFRIAIVCAMWLTGFDVPSLANLYLDKPLKAHTLMQAIARANRVHEGKNNGLVIDYCGILKNLRKALATFAGVSDTGDGDGGSAGDDPAKPDEELLDELSEAISFVRAFLHERDASLESIYSSTGFERNAAIDKAKEAVNENDEVRKRFEVMCREVFKKFKSCINISGINEFRNDYDAINIVYKSLQSDVEKANIDHIIKQLHEIVDEAVGIQKVLDSKKHEVYDISKIDFELLRREFEKQSNKQTLVHDLKQAIDKKLTRLLEQNPLRTDFQEHYERIIEEYNKEKDRQNIERTFEELFKFVQGLKDEETRAMREGLDEESLAIFDLIRKKDLDKKDIKIIKEISVELLDMLKKEKLKVDHWREREFTRDAVEQTIYDFLFSDDTGLPIDAYDEDEIGKLSVGIFQHVYRVYPTLPSPYYAQH